MKGEADLIRQLRAVELGVSVALSDETERQANKLVAAMKVKAPVGRPKKSNVPHRVRTGGELRDSIGWAWRDAPAGTLMKATGAGLKRGIVIFAGSRRTAGKNSHGAYWAQWVEFGTAAGVSGAKTAKGRKIKRTHNGAKPKPYFWPTYRAARQGIRSAISRVVNKAAEAVK